MTKRNSYFNEETYTKVLEENKEILEDYILEMKANARSEKTVYQYSADIKMFYCYIHDFAKNKSVLDLKKRDFRRFFLALQDNGASSARINRVQCSLRNMLEFVTNDDDEYDEYGINAMKGIKGLQKEEVREIHFLTDDHIQMLVNHLIEKGKYQQALYLTLSYESAGRRNEIFQIKKDGFLDSNKTNEVIGKRAKKFRLIYFDRSREIAKMYLDQRGEDDIESMWIVGRGNSIREAKYETLYNWTISFRKILKKLTGEEIDFNPHSYRHSSLEAYENGSHYVLKELGKDKLDITVLKALANHESIETTMSYLKDKDQELLNKELNL
ncbi:tyrosine-type recombinase/integrase [Staphylococcus equorum]|uniref:Site-specific integrase n=1 Tax=Staphylococcus equorum TaxID=246432 RepID=A0A9X4R592_9STAP|nr:site-specific integrase [Staphylococcus equorum]MDG0860338.1 site-specific integrase [Staphylococcus equorum]